MLALTRHVRFMYPLVLGLDHGKIDVVATRKRKGFGDDENDQGRMRQGCAERNQRELSALSQPSIPSSFW